MSCDLRRAVKSPGKMGRDHEKERQVPSQGWEGAGTQAAQPLCLGIRKVRLEEMDGRKKHQKLTNLI